MVAALSRPSCRLQLIQWPSIPGTLYGNALGPVFACRLVGLKREGRGCPISHYFAGHNYFFDNSESIKI